MKAGDKIKVAGVAGEVTITAIHDDTGRVEFEMADGSKSVAWPDAVSETSAALIASPGAPGAAVTYNGRKV